MERRTSRNLDEVRRRMGREVREQTSRELKGPLCELSLWGVASGESRRESQGKPLENMNFCRLFLSCCRPLMTHLPHRHTKLGGIREKSDLWSSSRGGGSDRNALLRRAER
jgi:hypothetical protein